jgi:hypothetical protein
MALLDFHNLMVAIHALSATGAFFIGVSLVFQDADARRQLRLGEALVVALVLMEGFLVAAVLSHPAGLPQAALVIFTVLLVLGGALVVLGVEAWSVLRRRSGDQLSIVSHVGFVLISLFDGFSIVGAFDLGAPGWLLAVIAVGAVAVGVYFVNSRKKTLIARSRASGPQLGSHPAPVK